MSTLGINIGCSKDVSFLLPKSHKKHQLPEIKGKSSREPTVSKPIDFKDMEKKKIGGHFTEMLVWQFSLISKLRLFFHFSEKMNENDLGKYLNKV